MIDYKIKNVINPIALENIQFGGKVALQADIFFNTRVRSEYAQSVIYKETEEQFYLRNDDEKPVGVWRGEFWGKWIISASRVARYTHDEDLKAFIKEAAHNLLSTQDNDGYIGTYKDPTNVLPCDPEIGRTVVGVPCDHNWNVWCRKYTLWGLLEAYMLTEDAEILSGAVRFADQLIGMLDKLGIKITSCGTFNGLPAGSTMKPMLILYSLTGDEKYLNFAKSIADDWEREDGKVPNIISNALDKRPVHEWYPLPEKWAKAYEMMSCIDGIISLYKYTGVEKYLKASENMYELLWENEQNLLFSVGFNDQFAHGKAWANSISEPCDVIHWIRVCSELYKLTGDVKYVNTIEKSFYNAFLASSFKDGTWGARGVRSVGRHMVAQGQAGMKYSHCCVNNVPRGFLNVAEMFVMEEAGGLVINYYTDFTAKTELAEVEISGSYLKDGRALIKINAKRGFDLRLRVPDCSLSFKLNGNTVTDYDNGYFKIAVAPGKTELELAFEFAIVLRELEKEPEHFDSQDFRVRRFVYDNPVKEEYMTWDKRATLLYGPLLLTRSKLVGNDEAEMFESQSVAHRGYECTVSPIDKDGVNYAFKVSFRNSDSVYETVMCDYASGTNIYSKDDDKLFNIFI